MRKLAFIFAAVGALTLAVPAFAASGNTAAQTRPASAAQHSSTQAGEFSAQRRHYQGRRHWRGGSHWRGHRHWYGPRRHWRGGWYGWNRCRTVWRPYAGWVRVCRW